MSMNHIGKGLVFVHVTISLLAMGLAAGLFLRFIDLGWKEPRKDLDVRIPSEFDKRAAALRESYRVLASVTPFLKNAQAALTEVEPYLAQNHLWYQRELAKLRSDPNPIEVKEVKYAGGVLVLDPPGKPFGKPEMGAKIDGLDKSQVAYEAELKKLQKNIDDVLKESADWIAKQKDVTFKLNGKDDTGKVVKTGLYALLDNEKQAQDQARFEKEYLTPIWVEALKEADVLRQRRLGLEETLARLQKAIPKGP